jgi:hypothetical protein
MPHPSRALCPQGADFDAGFDSPLTFLVEPIATLPITLKLCHSEPA